MYDNDNTAFVSQKYYHSKVHNANWAYNTACVC